MEISVTITGNFDVHSICGALVNGEAIEKPRAARALQILLTAAHGRVGRVPRGVATAGAVGVANLRAAGGAARPVVAGVIGIVSVGAPIRL